MSRAPHPDRIWWSAAEIAEARLPDMPATKRGVNIIADRVGWQADARNAQRRTGRGGGWEYHWSLFPDRARMRLLREAAPGPAPASAPRVEGDDLHAAYERLPQKSKDRAVRALRILRAVEGQLACGVPKNVAVVEIAAAEAIAPRTIWTWYDRVSGRPEGDWLPALGRSTARARKTPKAPIDPAFMEVLKADYLRLDRPAFRAAYRRTERICEGRGIAVPQEPTARRRLNAEVPRVTRVLLREGYTGLAKCFPPQIRDRTGMEAMEGVNADCHKFDVFVMWPGHDKPARAQIIAFQDIYSGKILSWRIDHTPNKVMVMAAFGDMVDEWGIPQHCLFDNGREFANKWLTGGATTRFRFKVRDDDPAGVLEQLGIKIHWATPGHGQAKPIERAFRDFAEDIAKDPRFAGAYVGNRPDAKPENYMSRAIDIDRFVEVVDDGIRAHNARQGRLSPTAAGRSFDETFATSYARAPIGKVTDEQRRIWLMGQEVCKLHATHGRLTLHKNAYWSDWMNEFAGQRLIARFDPADLHAGVYVYQLDGSYLGFAACEQAVGFFDLTEAHATSRRAAAIRRAERNLADKINQGRVEDVAAAMDETAARETEALDAKIVRPAFGDAPRTDGARVERPAIEDVAPPDEADRHDAFVLEFKARQGAERADQDDDERARFRRALEIEARSARGERIGKAEAEWLMSYAGSAEYRAMRRMYEQFGEGMLSG